jgi:ComF family protein
LNYKWSKFNHLLKISLFPQPCILCNTASGNELGLCSACLSDLPFHQNGHCPQCALPSTNNLICGACIASPPDFDATRSIFRYEYPISQLVQHYKYGQQLHLGDLFARLLQDQLLQHKPSAQTLPDLIIPMPLHPKRLTERGFNQSLEVAKILGKTFNIPVDYTACQRTKHSPPQASLPLKQRATNIKGAFKCTKSLTGLRVALIDDVMTTGASLNALAKAVKAKGASHVECWVIARTLLD